MQLQVVLDGLAGEVTEKQREILGRASEKITGLVSLSSELLDLAKIESGLISQERERFDILALLRDQVAFHLPRAQAKKMLLELSETPKAFTVLANKRNMEEVVSNLVTNAINYTPEGGKVTISVAEDSHFVRVSVSDTGYGIPKEDLERIFDPFYRVKTENTRYIVGTGLGLAIVKRIMDAHEGMMRVESELNRGSTFHVFIPSGN
jgi:signal transduction histidine kinase